MRGVLREAQREQAGAGGTEHQARAGGEIFLEKVDGRDFVAALRGRSFADVARGEVSRFGGKALHAVREVAAGLVQVARSLVAAADPPRLAHRLAGATAVGVEVVHGHSA